MDKDKKPRIIALLATAILLLALIVALTVGELATSAKPDREWPPRKHSEIIMDQVEEETYVRVVSASGDNVTETDNHADDFGASDVDSDLPTQPSLDAVNSGPAKGDQAPPVASNNESPVKQKPSTKPSGNNKPDDSEAVNARRQQQAAQNINNRMQNRFSGQGKDQGGKSSTNDGTAASNGQGGGRGLGMTASVDQTPPSDKIGTIVVEVIVMPDGSIKPGSARIAVRGNSGPAATDIQLQRRCLQDVYRCRFSRPVGETSELTGRVSFRWTDKK